MNLRSRLMKSAFAFVLLLLAGVGAFTRFVGEAPINPHAHAAGIQYQGTMLHAQNAGLVQVNTLGHTQPGSATPQVMPMMQRPGTGSAAPAATTNYPMVHSAAGVSPLAGSNLLQSFDGVSAVTNMQAVGFDLEPPDQSMATDGTYVLHAVNLTAALYTTNGQVVVPPFSLFNFFNASPNNIVSDPRAYYDAASQHWFLLVWEDDFVNGKLGPAFADLAVSTGNSPMSWNLFKIDVSDPNGAGCPCFPDFTIIGIDQYNFYMLPNEFQNYGQMGFNGSQIYAIALSDLFQNTPQPNVVHFGNLSVAGVLTYHLQPAITHDAQANAEYFLSALDPNGTFDNRLGLWAMTNQAHIPQGVMPTLSATVINSEAYAFPVNAQAPPGFNAANNVATSGLVLANFDAMQEVQFMNGHLIGALDTVVTIAGDAVPRDGIAWFEVTPVLSNGVISAASQVTDQGYIAQQALYLLDPHIEQSFAGATAIDFTYGAMRTFLSAGYVTRSPGGTFSPIQAAAAGAAPDNGFTSEGTKAGRWGDNSAGQLAPDGRNLWFATEYIAGNGDKAANWSN